MDVRLHNVSQLAGFAKRDDLRYFLQAIGEIGYEHRPELAPDDALLDDHKQRRVTWPDYERRFLALLAERGVEATLPRETLDHACLLCSEAEAQHCHRRLVGAYLERAWGDLEIVHL